MDNVQTKIPILDFGPHLKESVKMLSLASDCETQESLKKKGIEAILWEDCYKEEDLQRLNESFTQYCRSYFLDKEGKDRSLYDGLSIGDAISFFLYYGFETWVRILYIFEEIAKKGIDCKIYMPDKDYFPEGFSDYIKLLNRRYKVTIETEVTNENIVGFDPTPRFILSIQRTKNTMLSRIPFRGFSKILKIRDKIFDVPKEGRINCFVSQMRNFREYVDTLYNSGLAGRFNLFFSINNFYVRSMGRYLLKPNVYIFDDSKGWIKEEDEASSREYLKKIYHFIDSEVSIFEGLGDAGGEFFSRIFKDHLKESFKNQIELYIYLLHNFEKYKINTTLSGGHNTPMSYYASHIMRKRNGKSFFLPHGMVDKDKRAKIRSKLADYFFYYSESEKKTMKTIYPDIEDTRFLSLKFKKELPLLSHNRFKEKKDFKVLLLFDSFADSLTSRINKLRSFTIIYNILKNENFKDVHIRAHKYFFIYNKKKGSLPVGYGSGPKYIELQNPNTLPIEKIIGNYDLIIGPMSSMIYEAMQSKVIFITLTPDHLPFKDVNDIDYYHWFPELFPKMRRSFKEFEYTLKEFNKDPNDFYKKYCDSVEKIKLCKDRISSLWSNIDKIYLKEEKSYADKK